MGISVTGYRANPTRWHDATPRSPPAAPGRAGRRRAGRAHRRRDRVRGIRRGARATGLVRPPGRHPHDRAAVARAGDVRHRQGRPGPPAHGHARHHAEPPADEPVRRRGWRLPRSGHPGCEADGHHGQAAPGAAARQPPAAPLVPAAGRRQPGPAPARRRAGQPAPRWRPGQPAARRPAPRRSRWPAPRRRPAARVLVVVPQAGPERGPAGGRPGADADVQVVPVALHLVGRVEHGQGPAAGEVRA
jgi:hypothetical protein